MTAGIKFKGTKIVHLLKDDTHTHCGVDINKIPHNSEKKRVYELMDAAGLKCTSDIKFGEEFPKHVLCSRCNTWAHYREKR